MIFFLIALLGISVVGNFALYARYLIERDERIAAESMCDAATAQLADQSRLMQGLARSLRGSASRFQE
jgi:hypothetical protein